MKPSKFFRYVQRFNAIAIASRGLFGILGSIFLSIALVGDFRTKSDSNTIDGITQENVQSGHVLGGSQTLSGTPYTMAYLYKASDFGRGFSSGYETGNPVNHLFINISNGENRWLLPDVNHIILESAYLYDTLPLEEHSEGANSKVIAILYTLVEKDTNGDGKLTDQDKTSVATSLADGTGFVKHLENIDKVFVAEQTSSNTLLLLYQKAEATFAEIYSVPEMKMVSQKAVSKI